MNAVYSLRDLRFSYPGQADVITGLSVDIMPDRIVAVVGGNGTGKSTLLNLLDFLLVPRAGDIRFMGRRLLPSEYVSVRRHIGFLPQNPYLFATASVCNNLLLGLRFQRTDRKERQARAGEWLERLGLASLTDTPAGQLSSGQKQLLALARLLVLQPQVLLLDEPFTYLDAAAAALCIDVLRNMPDYGIRLAVLTTHDRQGARGLETQVLSMTGAEGDRTT